MHKSGDENSLEELILKNNGLIWNIVRKFWYTQIDSDDLYQIACIGFIKSVKKFNFSFNVELSTYATEYIFGEIKKFLRDDGIIKISRNIKELNKQIKHLEQKYSSELSATQISQKLNVPLPQVELALKSRKQVESLNNYISENNNNFEIDNIKYQNNFYSDEYIIDKIFISEIVNTLNVRAKTIIDLRYFKEKTQSQISNILGISQVQVSRIEKKALAQLKCKLIRGDA